MKVTGLSTYLADLSPEAVQRISSTLSSTRLGYDVDLVTPLIGRDDPQPDNTRLALARDLFKRVTPSGLSELDTLEAAQLEKVGPYSIKLPWTDAKDVPYLFFHKKPWYKPDRSGLAYAAKQLDKLRPHGRLLPVSVELAYLNMPHGTNLGAPYFTSDSEYRYDVLLLAKEVIAENFPDWGDPCMLYGRSQPRGHGMIPKQRAVWGYPHYITVLELMIQMALLPWLAPMREFSAWNDADRVNETITYVFEMKRNAPILSVDFKAFDQSIHYELIEMAFDFIRGCFSDVASELIDYVEYQFLNIGLITPDGILSDRVGSVPSGSGLTNLIDSLVQILVAHYCAYRTRNEIVFLTVQGDDGVWVLKRPFEIEDLSSAAFELNLTLNDDKGGVSEENVFYLQNLHSSAYRVDGLNVGVRPIMRVLNGMLSYERIPNPWNSFDDTIRWWQQAESARYHPKFPALAKFLYDHDLFSRALDVKSVLRRAGGLGSVERDLKQDSFPYGKSPLSGINDFAVVRELTKLKERHRKSEA